MKKEKMFGLRMTADERGHLRGKAQAAGIKEAEYFRQLIKGSDPVSEARLEEIKWELNKIGVNINQLAYRANSKGYSADIHEALFSELDKIKKLNKTFEAIKWQ